MMNVLIERVGYKAQGIDDDVSSEENSWHVSSRRWTSVGSLSRELSIRVNEWWTIVAEIRQIYRVSVLYVIFDTKVTVDTNGRCESYDIYIYISCIIAGIQ